jgi:hypothetical protein
VRAEAIEEDEESRYKITDVIGKYSWRFILLFQTYYSREISFLSARYTQVSISGTRLKEHQKAVSTLDKGKSALAEHVCYTKHEIAWENSKVITTNNRYGQRLCLEAWLINMSNHALNRDDGACLPEEYMYLIGR